MKLTSARRAAFEVLRRSRDELLDRALAGPLTGLPDRDRRWVHELVYGTVRLRGRLDHRLAGRVHDGLGSLEPDVLDVLRLGVYQLTEMDGVPAYAAVSQSVELARSSGLGRAAGLVNGVLQSLVREPETSFPAFDADPVAHLSTWGSHPAWLVRRWVERYGPADARALVEADNRRPSLYIRPVGIDARTAAARLMEAGIEAAVEPMSGSVRLGESAAVGAALAVVPGVVQDPAATLVVGYALGDGVPLVLDLCAAPGGKCLGMAETTTVVAADRSVERLARLRENRLRLGAAAAGVAGIVAADALRPPFRPAPSVLLDVPCTGTGTLRRHPDGRWRVDPEMLASLVGVQQRILEAAVPLVEPGGLLVYATCSLEPEENGDQVDRFVARHEEFERAPAPADTASTALDGEDLVVLPQRHGFDGAFAARLRRKG